MTTATQTEAAAQLVVDNSSVACSECGSAIAAPCVGPMDFDNDAHPARRELAYRRAALLAAEA